MTQSNIPDSISLQELEELHSSAPTDAGTKPSFQGVGPEKLSVEDVEDIVHHCLMTMQEKVQTPVAHKLALHMIINQMIVWHTTISQGFIEDEQSEQAIDWARDAGKFQAIANILDTIAVSGDDFTGPE